MEAAPPTKRKRRSKWDVKAVDAPTVAPAAPVSALEAAQSAVARAMPPQLSTGLPGLPATQQANLKPVTPEATVGLCSCSASARRRLVARGTHEEITAKTGAAVTTKGRYFPPAEAEQAGTEALHLHLTGESQEQVDAAVAMVNSLLQTQQQPAVQGCNTQAPWGARAAPTPAVGFSHFLAVGIQPEVTHGFDVSAKLSGPQGSFLVHIGREARCAVSLRGGTSSQDPLGIFIDQAPSHEALRHAVGLAESLLATVRAEYSSWIHARQPLVGSMPLAAPLPLPSAEPYLGPSYATFQSAVKSSQQQQPTSLSTGSSQIDHSNSSVNASNSNGVSGAPAAAGQVAAPATVVPHGGSGTGSITGKQQQRSFAAIGFNYNSKNDASSGSPSVVTPMPMAMPAALKRPRSPPKPQHSNHHQAFQELASSSGMQDHAGDSGSVAANTSAASTSTVSSSASATVGTVDGEATSASQVSKKAFWMA